MSEEGVIKYRSVFISDVHLGFKNADPTFLLEFMKTFECETIYLVGDIITATEESGTGEYHLDIHQKLLLSGNLWKECDRRL